MRHTFAEMVLPFTRAQREHWNQADAVGKRVLVPSFHAVHPMVVRQPTYHFGEFFTLRHLHEREGWLGYRFFVLAYLDDFANERYAPGGEQIRKLIPRARLDAYIRARGTGRTDAGDPDLFLYKPTGETMFLEVKVGKDRFHDDGRQLQALGQIREVLGSRAEVVHLVEEGLSYSPKTYWVDVAPIGTHPTAHGIE